MVYRATAFRKEIMAQNTQPPLTLTYKGKELIPTAWHDNGSLVTLEYLADSPQPDDPRAWQKQCADRGFELERYGMDWRVVQAHTGLQQRLVVYARRVTA